MFIVNFKAYVTGTLEKGVVSTDKELESEPVKLGNMKFPMIPVVHETKFYCTDQSNHKYHMEYKLSTVGLFGYMMDFVPMMRLYYNDELLKEFTMKFDKGTIYTGSYDWKDEMDAGLGAKDYDHYIRHNTPYTVQFGLRSLGKYWIPLRDMPFENAKAICGIGDIEVIHTWKHENHANLDFNGHKYLYIVDVYPWYEAIRYIGHWGIKAWSYDGSKTSKFKEKHYWNNNWNTITPLVRIRWYTDAERDKLCVTPFFYALNNKVESKTYTEGATYPQPYVDLVYSKDLDTPLTSEEVKDEDDYETFLEYHGDGRNY